MSARVRMSCAWRRSALVCTLGPLHPLADGGGLLQTPLQALHEGDAIGRAVNRPHPPSAAAAGRGWPHPAAHIRPPPAARPACPTATAPHDRQRPCRALTSDPGRLDPVTVRWLRPTEIARRHETSRQDRRPRPISSPGSAGLTHSMVTRVACSCPVGPLFAARLHGRMQPPFGMGVLSSTGPG